ncbi:unnamed protein product [Urochloa humidicola]
MEEELKNLIDDKWHWRVKKISERDFLAAFPNKQILEAFSRSKGCKMALYNTWATFSPSTRDPAASSVLETGWVQLSNIPGGAVNVEGVTAIAELAGEVLAVDELSLIKEGPARVKMQAREIEKLRGYLEISINGVGYDIKFTPERPSGRAQSSKPQPPPPKRPADDHSDEEDDEDLLDSDEERARKSNKSRGRDSSDSKQRKEGSHRGKQAAITNEQEEMQKNQSQLEEEVAEPRPIAVFDPTAGQIVNLETFQKERVEPILNSEQQEDEPGEDQTPRRVPTEDFYNVHTDGGGSRLIPKDKWPRLELLEEKNVRTEEILKPEELMVSQESLGLGEVEEEERDAMTVETRAEKGEEENWERALQSKRRTSKKRRFFPAVAARTSSRVDGIKHRGAHMAVDPGASQTPLNSFTILNSCENEDLENIAISCDVSLGDSKVEIKETLDIMKLEELARAAIAEAKYRQRMEQALAENHALEGENLELQVTNNDQRGVQEQDISKKQTRGGKRFKAQQGTETN